MEALAQFFNKLRIFFHREDFNRGLEEEMTFHLEQREEELRSEGMTSKLAHHAAMRQFGNAARLKDQSHAVVGFSLETTWQDFRYSLRQFRRNPGFAFTVILILGLGIGATSAIFSVVNPILFKSLPYPHPGRIMAIVEVGPDGSRSAGSFGMYRGLVERSRLFEAIALFKPWQPTITGVDQPERFDAQRVNASYFDVLGVPPVLGRNFQPSDDRLHGPAVVIISDSFWRRRFGADRGIIGRQIKLEESANSSSVDSDSYTVIGVMPADFENVLAPPTELWAPLQYDISQGRAWGHHLRTIGRLRSGVSEAQASQELNVLGNVVIHEQHPVTYGRKVAFSVSSLQGEVTRGVKPALLAILGAVLLVLIIACVNVTNLLLARGVKRRGEFAVRAALGAARSRLISQMLTESLLLTALGGIAGIVLAKIGVRALVALSPAGMPRVGAIAIDSSVFLFGLLITTFIGLAFGMIPAMQAARSDPNRDLKQGMRQTGGHRSMRSALVVAEVALALVLLICSGLLLRSIEHLFAIAPGFNPSHLLTMQIQEIGHHFESERSQFQFFDQALAAVRRVPSVNAAAFTSQLPLSGDLDEYGAQFDATPTQAA